MRRLVTYAVAFAAALLGGGLILQLIVERSAADETFIVAYLGVFVGGAASLVVLAAADALWRVISALDRAAAALAALTVAGAIALLALSTRGGAPRPGEHALILALAAPTLAMVAIEWWWLRRAKLRRGADTRAR